jgi:hypothetical protein
VVAVTGDGNVRLNDTPLQVEELHRKLGALIQLQPERAVLWCLLYIVVAFTFFPYQPSVSRHAPENPLWQTISRT